MHDLCLVNHISGHIIIFVDPPSPNMTIIMIGAFECHCLKNSHAILLHLRGPNSIFM